MAKKKIYPTLWWLYRDNLVPTKTFFLGYARSKLDIKEFLTKTAYNNMKVKPNEEAKFAEFVKLNGYLSGTYDKAESFKALDAEILKQCTKCPQRDSFDSESGQCNRIFYLALPPSVYMSVTKLLSENCKAKKFVSKFISNFGKMQLRIYAF